MAGEGRWRGGVCGQSNDEALAWGAREGSVSRAAYSAGACAHAFALCIAASRAARPVAASLASVASLCATDSAGPPLSFTPSPEYSASEYGLKPAAA